MNSFSPTCLKLTRIVKMSTVMSTTFCMVPVKESMRRKTITIRLLSLGSFIIENYFSKRKFQEILDIKSIYKDDNNNGSS